MKNLIICLTLLLFSLDTTATPSPTQEPDSKITKVTVYTEGAMITREIQLDGTLGQQVLLIKGLPASIESKSVSINGQKNVEILSINNSLEQIENADAGAISYANKLKTFSDSLSFKDKQLEILKIELEMIRANEKYGDSSGKTEINTVIGASDFYRKRIKEILMAQYDLTKKKNQLHIEKNEFIRLHNQAQSAPKTATQIKIKINAKTPSEKIILSYYIPNARWYPFYDVKVEGLDQKLNLYRKAYVSQFTGEDWDQVKLTLSNANPKESAILPQLQPYYLDGARNGNSYHHPHLFQTSQYKTYGKVFTESGEAVIGANIIIKELNIGTTTDVTGKFELNIDKEVVAEISYVGLETKHCIMKPGQNIFYLSEGAMLNEISIRGSRAEANYYYIDGIRVNTDNAQNMIPQAKTKQRAEIQQTKISAISSVEYHVKNPYTIKSDGEEIDVLLEVDAIAATYTYHASPSLSEKAYLIAKISDWHELDLLSGAANLFLSNTYKGVSYIDGHSTQDTLSISLGVDPEVIINREQIKDLYSKKILSKNVEEIIAFEIKVRNNKTSPIQVKLMDQIPISNNKDIKINVEETSQAQVEEETGIASWSLALSPGEEIVKRLKYKVKYPKNYKMIN